MPPLLPDGYYFHRRYLMEGHVAVDQGSTGQTFADEYRDTMLRAITLGSSPLPSTEVRAQVETCE